MEIVLLTALGVGGATVIGAVIGFIFKNITHKFSDIVLGFAAGIMLAASVWGLIIPSLESGGVLTCAAGVLFGALFIGACERLVPSLRFVAGADDASSDKAIKLLLAMALHNLPEGIAAGVSLGSGDKAGAFSVALGIAVQNLPEGMAVIPPMLSAGISRRRAFLLAVFTGAMEVVGTLLGHRAITFFSWILPFSLAFAGGAMLYVIADEMLPDSAAQGRLGAYIFTLGVCAMLVLNAYM